MSGKTKSSGAFTLLELVLCVSTIALVGILLLPAMDRIRQLGHETNCQSNLRSFGQAFVYYAQQREGRFPNKATWDTSLGAYSPWSLNPASAWSPQWQSITNWECYKGNDPKYYPSFTGPSQNPGMSPTLNDEPTCGPIVRFWTFWDPVHFNPDYFTTRYTNCADYKAWTSPSGQPYAWSRPYVANQNVTGGWDGAVNEGEYGKVMSNPKSVYRLYGEYDLGIRLELFANPSNKFMIFESEYGNDVLQINSDGNKAQTGTPDGKVLINSNLSQSPNVPPWCAGAYPHGGGGYGASFFAFRHMLPADQSLWQAQAQAAALYVDNHTGVIGPNSQIAKPSKWMPGL